MQKYLELNQSIYDLLAHEYQKKVAKKNSYDQYVMESISHMLTKQQDIRKKLLVNKKINLLELGCGVGALLKTFQAYSTIQTYAIDFSWQMVEFAKKNNPDAIIKKANILDIDSINNVFGCELEGKIDILIMSAFIHCFSVEDAKSIMDRIKNWISPDSIIYLDTTEEKESLDNTMFFKLLKNDMRLRYYRTLWTEKAFNEFIEKCGYEILEQNICQDNLERKWIRTIIKRT